MAFLLLKEKPPKHGVVTVYRCGLRVTGGWRDRVDLHRRFCETDTGQYILKMERINPNEKMAWKELVKLMKDQLSELEIELDKKELDIERITKKAKSVDTDRREIIKAAEELLQLHVAEEEGLFSGQPTADQWREAVSKLRTLIYE